MNADEIELQPVDDNVEQSKPKAETLNCPCCTQRIPADAKTCPLCGFNLVEPEAAPPNNNELELQPNASPIPVSTHRENKPPRPARPAKPLISLGAVMGWGVMLLIFAGLSYGGLYLYQKYFTGKSQAASLSPQLIPSTQLPPPSPPPPSGQQIAEREERSLAALQTQRQTEAAVVDGLKEELKTLQAKKDYYKAFNVMTYSGGVVSAHAKLLNRDAELAKATGAEVPRAQARVREAEKYLLEKLNQASELLYKAPYQGNIRNIDQIKEKLVSWREQIATNVKAAQQEIDAKEKLLSDLDAKINDAQNTLTSLKNSLKIPKAVTGAGVTGDGTGAIQEEGKK